MNPTTKALSTATAFVQSVELEITGTCQLRCTHCCTDSSPQTPAGRMLREDWMAVIDDVATLGIPTVQMIGGEPTLSPHLPPLINHAVELGLGVEVYSNLVHMRPKVWEALTRDEVVLATSYYSDDPAQHEQITGGRGNHTRTRANIADALKRGIPLRVGIVRVLDDQRVDEAVAELRELGVDPARIQVDRVRKVGRAAAGAMPSPSDLCGHCFRHRLSISPDGHVSGCILSRFLRAGNVRDKGGLAAILSGSRWGELTATVPMPRSGACQPHDSGDCDPANTIACAPKYPDVARSTLEGAAV
ncbi:radical SAM protein [Streptomyces sp. WMMC897]|uniref:radical SAM protein n=1 Tax=Streptomyces sp. WMMC897 TaxID=3014782 RepID=UPI0022B72A10|nr:radical SAM protein [Streptomyces sp. WMMC897]MCZ7414330.1 radical SAM protein [Streptomyces sp. WMMC897]